MARSIERLSPAHERALSHFRAGRLAEAEEILAAVAREAPDHATAWSDLGVVKAAKGRFDLAIACYERALAIRPGHAGAHGNKGNALAALGRPAEALACLDRAAALAPGAAQHHNNKGGSLRALGRAREALACFDAALARAPKSLEAWSNRGNALAELGRTEEALASFGEALRLHPGQVEALTNRGVALATLGRFAEALADYDQAIARNPRASAAHNNRGDALRALGRHAEAAAALLQALALEPNSAETLNNLGNLFLELKRPREALAAYDASLRSRPEFVVALGNRARALLDLDRPQEALASSDLALALAPRDFTAHNARGVALAKLGREIEALANYDCATSLRPDSELARNNKGLALIQIGRIDAGVAVLQQALAVAPRNARIHYNLALARRHEPGDSAFAALSELLAPHSDRGGEERILAEFAMAKALDDIGDHETSFRCLARGNAARRATIAYDEAAALDGLARTRSAFTPEFIASRKGGDPSPLPVFIIGMPRSGASLVEQILASHSSVHGAGEITDFEHAARESGDAVAAIIDQPEAVAFASPERLAYLGANYVRRLRAMAPEAERIVNKMPGNFRVAGLIALALPNARIIHVAREPRDCCLSCFATLFTRDVGFAYDLGELGRYNRAYRETMAGWGEALPSGMLLETRYEDVVADLEGQARRIVAHCGLAWDPKCLDFYSGERSVRTASLAQVRRPLYASSVGRWRAYERFLGPLLAALESRDVTMRSSTDLG